MHWLLYNLLSETFLLYMFSIFTVPGILECHSVTWLISCVYILYLYVLTSLLGFFYFILVPQVLYLTYTMYIRRCIRRYLPIYKRKYNGKIEWFLFIILYAFIYDTYYIMIWRVIGVNSCSLKWWRNKYTIWCYNNL